MDIFFYWLGVNQFIRYNHLQQNKKVDIMREIQPEELIADITKVKETFRYDGTQILTEEEKALFVPYSVETVEDIIMIMALALKEDNSALLVEIHDRLMVSNIELAYDILIVMLRIGDDKMYYNFVPYTELSKIQSKGIYRRCLGSIGFYDMGSSYNNGSDMIGYNNAVLGMERYEDFGKDIIGYTYNGTDRSFETIDAYRVHVSTKYAELIEKLLKV